MQAAMKIEHVIVDGSNIATEGRDAPSLAQLDEAVQAFIEEYSPRYVTVVVDATFPNRIERKERKTYEDAVNANELITPPAGAIGRGDAFVLQIARRAGASILSNDSFQEFHGEYPWLFEKGRLIGGKPVPHVGWVFMERAPVRGPTSRRAVSEARKVAKVAKVAKKVAKTASATADGAAAVDAALAGVAASATPDVEPADGKPARRRRARPAKAATGVAGVEASVAGVDAGTDAGTRQPVDAAAPAGDGGAAVGRASGGVAPYNEALPFIEFVAEHPVGSEVEATIERFSSHGAYVMVGEARAYVPLRNLADPAPRSAKEVLRAGDVHRFVVASIDTPRRGIDLAVPGVVEVSAAALPEARAAELEPGDEAVTEAPHPQLRSRAAGGATATKAAARKAVATKTEAGPASAKKTAATKTGARPAAAKKTAKATAAKKVAATTTAVKAAAGKAAAGKATATEKVVTKAAGKATATTETVRTSAARKTGARPAAAKKTAATKTGARPAAAKKTAATKTGAKKAAPASKASGGKAATTGADGSKAGGSNDESGGAVVVVLPTDAGGSPESSPGAAKAHGT
jgi:hypothetical protein